MKKKKIGRNDPCPCGSGKKYKKCCLGKPSTQDLSDYLLSKKPVIKERTTNKSTTEISNELKPTTLQKKSQRRKQHYVPIWYQKRFLPDDQTSLYYLNLHPFKDLPGGRQIKLKEIYEWGPGNCFHEKNLYTTRIFGRRNTDIEEFLFGKIDCDGSLAIKALVENNYKQLSKAFIQAFEYMDAQKLRTPKGLDWIRSNYFQLSQIELMLEMQFLRTMHCTMWVEGVMEIISAEDSDVKFIISDHPVTIYNRACSLNSRRCKYPNDPLTAWKASQTVFPLDLNHCLILTNLEYARDPDGSDPLVSRTNPRYFAQTLTRWDTVIRERRLKPEEVSTINYIVKKRARKHIAAAQLEWFYPEKVIPQNEWKSLYKVLLPSKDKIHSFGGEIYVGGKNGKLAWYQDEFGRSHTSREDNDNPVRKYSIKQRNQILYNAILEIFGFSKGRGWDDFRKELTNDKIKELYGVVGSLWNPDTEIMSLMPKPSNKLSAFYSGTIDPRVIPLTVAGFSLYVDKIILISPFPNPRAMNKEYSPYHTPAQYKNDTIKNVFTMMQIMPLIDADIVEMIPDPCDFDPYFRHRIYKMAEARVKSRGPSKEDIEYAEKLRRDDFKRFMLNLPAESLKHQIKRALPDISDEEMEKFVEYAEKEQLADPLAPLQSLTPGKDGGQLQIFRMGGNLEMALYLAQATGSYVYTDVPYRWQEIQLAIIKKPGKEDIDPWAPVVQALSSVPFVIYFASDPRFWCRVKEKGILKEFISLYRRICTSVRNIKDPYAASAEAKELAFLINKMNMRSIWSKIEKDYKKFSKGISEQAPQYKLKIPASHLIPANGLSTNGITQILLTHGSNTPYWDAVPLGAFLDLQKMRQIQ